MKAALQDALTDERSNARAEARKIALLIAIIFGPFLALADLPTTSIPDGISPVTDKTLVLLGHGLESKESHNWVQLACVGDPVVRTEPIQRSCNVLKFVYFNGDSAYYFGNPIIVNLHQPNPTQKEIQSAVKRTFKRLANYRYAAKSKSYRTWHRIPHIVTGVAIEAGIMVTMMTAMVTAGVYTGGVGTVLFAIATKNIVPLQNGINDGLAYGGSLMTQDQPMGGLGSYARASKSKGSNKKISGENFRELLRFMGAEALEDQAASLEN